jgi:hypothetical protein
VFVNCEVSVVIEPLGTIRYGELVVVLYVPPLILLAAVLASAVRRRRSDRTVPKG